MSGIPPLFISLAGKRVHSRLPEITAPIHAFLDALEQEAGPLRINLITGLADGADTIAAEAFQSWKPAKGSRVGLTGVFPFEEKAYLQTIDDRIRFQKLKATCHQQIFLDGCFLPMAEGADNKHANACRAAGYRQQAAYLIETGDLLLAVADEKEPGKVGGTLETVTAAFKRGMPVLFLSLCDLRFYWLPDNGQYRNLLISQLDAMQPTVVSNIAKLIAAIL